MTTLLDEQGTLIHQSDRTQVRRVRIEGGSSVVLKSSCSEFPTAAERMALIREFELMKSLALPGACAALELREGKRGPLLVLADAGEHSLHHHIPNGGMSAVDFFPIALALAQTVGALHASGVIHKDINPNNIVLDAQGLPTLIDFGISTRLSREYADARTTHLEGTLEYIAPEQTGRMNRAVDWRSDLYSLGATYYRMLTGRSPVASASPTEMIHTIIARQPMPLSRLRPDLPEQLGAIVDKLLSKAMEARYQSAEGLATDLAQVRAAIDTSDTSTIELGKDDYPRGFALPQRLYGRDEELQRLFAAFDRLAKGEVAALLVAGPSGAGKSSLIRELQRPSAIQRGLLAEGKFEQFRRDARSGLAMAIRDALRRILAESEERLAYWRERLAWAVGGTGGLLLDELPELELILGEQAPVPLVSSEENRARVQALWLRVMQSFAAPDHPFVMFIDDLQWADSESIALLQTLISDADTSSLLLLGAWRDDEVDAAHPVSALVRELGSTGVSVEQLSLGPIGAQDLEAMVIDTLRCSASQAKPLAALLYERSRGNPLFAREFLASLNETGVFLRDAEGVTWDLEVIAAHPLRDDLGKLMSNRIRRLGSEAQQVLTLAACIGARFDVQTLAIVSELGVAGTLRALWPSLEAGLIQPIGDGAGLMPTDAPSPEHADSLDSSAPLPCRFAHDRVQQAAHDFLGQDEQARVHLRTGRLLLDSLDPGSLRGASLVEVIQHFDESLELVEEPSERARLMELYLAAGLRAKRVAADAAAETWLETGRSLLRSDAWATQYDAALQLHAEGAEAARLRGDFEKMEALADEVVRHAKSPLDRSPIEETRILHLLARDQPAAAVASGVAALRPLGVRLSAHPSAAAVGRELLTALFLVRRRSLEELSGLPKMQDQRVLAAIRIMTLTGTPAWLSSQNLFIIFACRITRLSLKHGNCAESTWGYGTLAVVLANVLGKTKEGWELGHMAQQLMEELGARELTAKNYASFYGNLFQWNQHWREGLAPLAHGQRVAVEVGDIEYGCTVALVRSWSTMLLEPFDVAEQIQVECLAYCRPRQAANQTQCIQVILALTRELRGMDISDLDVKDDEATLAELAERGSENTLFLLHLRQGMLAYLLGDPSDAVKHLRRARKHELAMLASLVYMEATFLLALSLLACWPAGLSAGQRIELRRMRRRLRTWANNSPTNYLHKHQLVEAEYAMAKGRGLAGLQGFETASKTARNNGYVLDAAITIERAARHAFALGLERIGWSMLRDALVAFRSWGLDAKADLLDAELKGGPGVIALATATSTTTAPKSVDASIVFRATRAISEEIVLDKLVQDLVQLLLQHTAAQRGVLVLERGGLLMVEACSAIADGGPTFPVPVELSDELPVSQGVIRYVVRTRESVVLHDAAVEGMFVDDPYIARERPRSVLCAPLLNQKRAVAVVYLENNLIANSFTAERLEVVGILLSQAALSIRNAHLYANLERSNLELERYSHTLEQKVADRTQDLEHKNSELAKTLQQLRDTQEHLVSQQKLASLGALTAGIAHELRNPLNFVVNFAEISVELVDEVAESIDEAREAIGPNEVADLGEVLTMLRSNIEKIDEHGHRAEQIIGNMLMHSRQSDSDRETVDLNRLVEKTVNLAIQGMHHLNHGVGVETRTTLDPAVGQLKVFPSELRRVLVNIVNNAFDAMDEQLRITPDYTCVLDVSTKDLPNAVHIRLADNGPGLEPEAVGQLFEPFFTTKPAGKGTGLGLSLSHDIIVQGHGGSLTVEDTPGGGATFVISLPKDGPIGTGNPNASRT